MAEEDLSVFLRGTAVRLARIAMRLRDPAVRVGLLEMAAKFKDFAGHLNANENKPDPDSERSTK